MHNPVAVTLKRGAETAVWLGLGALGGVRGGCVLGEVLLFTGDDALRERLGDWAGWMLVSLGLHLRDSDTGG